MKSKWMGGIEFINVRAGSFIMGALNNDSDAKQDEMKRCILITRDFYLQRTPLTVKEYMLFVDDADYSTNYNMEKWDGQDWREGPYFHEINNDPLYPVVGVSYNDALAFIDWFNRKHGLEGRLPTEAEFEYAARGKCECTGMCQMAEKARQLKVDRAEHELPRKKPLSVDAMLENSIGLLGMHCSIWQWCSDWFYYYDLEEQEDPVGPDECPAYAPWKGEKWKPGKVIRGGSFSYPYYHSRCSNRHYSCIEDRNNNVGFRLCLPDNSDKRR